MARAVAAKPGQRMRDAAAVAARTAAAVVAGYASAHAFAACMAVVLPFARPDRVATGTLLSFLVACAVAIHAFAARSAWAAWWRPGLLAALMMAVALAFPDAGMRP